MAFPPLSAYYSPLDNGNLPAPQPLHPPGLGRAPRLAEAPQPQSLAQQHVSQGQMVAVAAQSVVPAYTPHAPPVQTMNALQNQTASITPAQTTSTPLPPKSGHFAPTPTLTDADVAVLANYTPSVKWTVDGHNPANPTIEYATDLANERRRTAYWVTEMQHAMVDLRNYTDEPSSDGVKMFTNGTVNSQDVPPDHVKLMAYKLVDAVFDLYDKGCFINKWQSKCRGCMIDRSMKCSERLGVIRQSLLESKAASRNVVNGDWENLVAYPESMKKSRESNKKTNRQKREYQQKGKKAMGEDVTRSRGRQSTGDSVAAPASVASGTRTQAASTPTTTIPQVATAAQVYHLPQATASQHQTTTQPSQYTHSSAAQASPDVHHPSASGPATSQSDSSTYADYGSSPDDGQPRLDEFDYPAIYSQHAGQGQGVMQPQYTAPAYNSSFGAGQPAGASTHNDTLSAPSNMYREESAQRNFYPDPDSFFSQNNWPPTHHAQPVPTHARNQIAYNSRADRDKAMDRANRLLQPVLGQQNIAQHDHIQPLSQGKRPSLVVYGTSSSDESQEGPRKRAKRDFDVHQDQ